MTVLDSTRILPGASRPDRVYGESCALSALNKPLNHINRLPQAVSMSTGGSVNLVHRAPNKNIKQGTRYRHTQVNDYSHVKVHDYLSANHAVNKAHKVQAFSAPDAI